MEHRHYDTDLTDAQYALLGPLLPRPKKMGRPPADLRAVLNAIFYLVRTGCQWRLLPHDFRVRPANPVLVLLFKRHKINFVAFSPVWPVCDPSLAPAQWRRRLRRCNPILSRCESLLG